MATSRICEFLQGNGISYELRSHAPAFTAPQVAQYSHIPGKHMAKTIVVWIDGNLALAVVPATKDLNLEYLCRQAEARSVRLAEEGEFVGRFRGCQLGAVPPFGNLFGIRTYVDYDLTLEDTIAFNAGTHTDLIQMRFTDYMRTALPCVVEISAGSGPQLVSRRECCKDDTRSQGETSVCVSSPTGAD
ncbi:MAG TPA: YbaK/EbsC family protein [Tepidisphaeraceae bacterium]|nr:YbaK/EbsC family protein [Tepidisphaeraceae bacterium]